MEDQWDCKITNNYVAPPLQHKNLIISIRVSVLFFEQVFGKIFWRWLGYIVAKAPPSPRNSTWFTRPFLLVRGWGLGMRLTYQYSWYLHQTTRYFSIYWYGPFKLSGVGPPKIVYIQQLKTMWRILLHSKCVLQCLLLYSDCVRNNCGFGLVFMSGITIFIREKSGFIHNCIHEAKNCASMLYSQTSAQHLLLWQGRENIISHHCNTLSSEMSVNVAIMSLYHHLSLVW